MERSVETVIAAYWCPWLKTKYSIYTWSCAVFVSQLSHWRKTCCECCYVYLRTADTYIIIQFSNICISIKLSISQALVFCLGLMHETQICSSPLCLKQLEWSSLSLEELSAPLLHLPPLSSHPVFLSQLPCLSFFYLSLTSFFPPKRVPGTALSNALNYTHHWFTERRMGAKRVTCFQVFPPPTCFSQPARLLFSRAAGY